MGWRSWPEPGGAGATPPMGAGEKGGNFYFALTAVKFCLTMVMTMVIFSGVSLTSEKTDGY